MQQMFKTITDTKFGIKQNQNNLYNKKKILYTTKNPRHLIKTWLSETLVQL